MRRRVVAFAAAACVAGSGCAATGHAAREPLPTPVTAAGFDAKSPDATATRRRRVTGLAGEQRVNRYDAPWIVGSSTRQGDPDAAMWTLGDDLSLLPGPLMPHEPGAQDALFAVLVNGTTVALGESDEPGGSDVAVWRVDGGNAARVGTDTLASDGEQRLLTHFESAGSITLVATSGMGGWTSWTSRDGLAWTRGAATVAGFAESSVPVPGGGLVAGWTGHRGGDRRATVWQVDPSGAVAASDLGSGAVFDIDTDGSGSIVAVGEEVRDGRSRPAIWLGLTGRREWEHVPLVGDPTASDPTAEAELQQVEGSAGWAGGQIYRSGIDGGYEPTGFLLARREPTGWQLRSFHGAWSLAGASASVLAGTDGSATAVVDAGTGAVTTEEGMATFVSGATVFESDGGDIAVSAPAASGGP